MAALGLLIGHTTSGAEVLQGWLPGARVVKTLNQVGSEIMARNDHLPQRPVQFVAGDDAAAKGVAMGLLADLGFQPLDAGDLRQGAAAGAAGDGLDQPGDPVRQGAELGLCSGSMGR